MTTTSNAFILPFAHSYARGGRGVRVLVPTLPSFHRNGYLGHLGYSLIELLAVLLIVSLLTAIALPTVKNVMVERKTSVAALEVKAFLEAARARAIARGRSVSVILERLSSRTEDGVTSSTANAMPAVAEDNFDVYNSCIRMTMAESLRSVEFESTATVTAEATGIPLVDSDLLTAEPARLLQISPNDDPRLNSVLIPGNEIELIDQNSQVYTFRINKASKVGTTTTISINNEGDLANPFGSIEDIKDAADNQVALKSFQPLPSSFPAFRIRTLPNPVTSTINELPRGSCIDLSLSGLATDDPNVNTSTNATFHSLRDCSRQFASDWIWPRVTSSGGTPTPLVPAPAFFRPVYLTFSPNGTLQSILCNGPGSNTLVRIEPHSDVLLFVGRLDQVLPAVTIDDLAQSQANNFKTNLTDPTGYWVRISPTSGAIAATPAQPSHILEDIEIFNAIPNPMPSDYEPVGHLLNDSRSLAFTSEATSQ
jgi:prepilin-type N-terminal cleavage/methylation domain-containing protein